MPESHPEVRDSTAKELYANAIICAFPGCDQPLYRRNDDGSRTLNSRIAHIHARQENGPRWQPNMSSEDNRAVANLLLLCIEHADEIDQPQRVSLYPASTLQDWKRQQVELYDSLRTGWQITSEEAEEVIRKSDALEISIIAQTLNLGGFGGQAPGAAGGGGGAIGPGATGGGGGPASDSTRINLRGQDGVLPGSGGGGDGFIHPDSPLLWQGGDRTPTFGESSFVGVDGQDGGDTTFGPLDDGTAVTARGGIGARAGSGNRSRSDLIVASALLLANYVEFQGSFVYITGAAFQFYDVLNLGDEIRFSGAAVFEFGGVPSGEYALTIEAHDPENHAASSVTFVFTVNQPGDLLRVSCKFAIPAAVNEFGMWTIVAKHEERELARYPIIIKRGVPS